MWTHLGTYSENNHKLPAPIAGAGIEREACGDQAAIFKARDVQGKVLLALDHHALHLDRAERWNSAARYCSCWMRPYVGTKLTDIPLETQFLIAQEGDRYHLYIPLVDHHAQYRSVIQGADEQRLYCYLDGGSEIREHVDVLYHAYGADPYRLMEQAAELISQRYQFKLKKDYPTCEIEAVLGFSTWNSMYQNVTEENLIKVLDEYRDNDVPLGLLMVEDGFHSFGDERLTSMQADPVKFPRGLAPVLKRAKEEYGVKRITIWKAYTGYWRGLDPVEFADYDIKLSDYTYEPHLYKDNIPEDGIDASTVTQQFFSEKVAAEPTAYPVAMDRFIADFNRNVKAMGADGVKCDAMSWVEFFTHLYPNRYQAHQKVIQAVEQSCRDTFEGDYIYCSSQSSDYILGGAGSGVMRSSTDFWPDIPESHGHHIQINAVCGFWMGHFTTPDWDMFQTAHPSGAFHAAARAISGGPVYSTDEMGKMDASLLKKLINHEGRLLKCAQHAQVARRSFFYDIDNPGEPIAVFARNTYGDVLGLFQCGAEQAAQDMSVSLSDLEVVDRERRYVLHSYQQGILATLQGDETLSVNLGEQRFDILSCAPLVEGVAILGIEGKFNPLAAVTEVKGSGACVTARINDTGSLCIYSQQPITKLTVNGRVSEVARQEGERYSVELTEGSSEIEVRL